VVAVPRGPLTVGPQAMLWRRNGTRSARVLKEQGCSGYGSRAAVEGCIRWAAERPCPNKRGLGETRPSARAAD